MSRNNPGRAFNVVKMRNRAHGMTVNQVTITDAGLMVCDRLATRVDGRCSGAGKAVALADPAVRRGSGMESWLPWC